MAHIDSDMRPRKCRRAYAQPKACQRKYRNDDGHLVDDPKDHIAIIKDDLIKHFSKMTRKLSNNQIIILARELSEAFNIMQQFAGVNDDDRFPKKDQQEAVDG